MSVFTSILNLIKPDSVADAKQTFNLKTFLNDNWDKLDTFAAKTITTDKLVNNLAATQAGFGLDATQGKAIQDEINTINAQLPDKANKASPTFTGVVKTTNNTLDDGSGNIAASGTISANELITSGLYSPNLLFNPDFKLGTIGWTGIGLNGFALYYGPNGETTYIGNSTTNTGVNITSTKFPIAAGLRIAISVEMFAVGFTAGNMYTEIRFFNSSGAQLGASSVDATNGTGWTKYSFVATTPTGTAYADVRFVQDGTVINTNAAWRRIKVEYNSKATVFSDDCTLDLKGYSSLMPFIQSIGSVTGLKIQTGTVTTAATSSAALNTSVTFPTAFSSTPITFVMLVANSASLLPSKNSTSYFDYGIYGQSTTGFTLVTNQTAIANTYNWIAIGS